MFSSTRMVFLLPTKLDKQIDFLSNALDAERIVTYLIHIQMGYCTEEGKKAYSKLTASKTTKAVGSVH